MEFLCAAVNSNYFFDLKEFRAIRRLISWHSNKYSKSLNIFNISLPLLESENKSNNLFLNIVLFFESHLVMFTVYSEF